MVSFDVKSLFIKVPVKETLHIIQKPYVPQEFPQHLVELARLCLTTTYFTWNGTVYEQKEGAAMGSLLSPVLANIFMEAFEKEAIATKYQNVGTDTWTPLL